MQEQQTCAAAFFRSIGKDTSTEKEFFMSVGMDFRWMPVKNAPALLSFLQNNGAIALRDGYIRPTFDVSSVSVPVSYKPSPEFLSSVMESTPKNEEKKSSESSPTEDVMGKMIAILPSYQIEVSEFLVNCRKLSKSIGVTQEVAGLIVLREKGIDVSAFIPLIENSLRNESKA